MSVKGGKQAKRKPPLRWRRQLVQAELELPPGHGTAETDEFGSGYEDRQAPSASYATALPWWQLPWVVLSLAVLCAAALIAAGLALRTAQRERSIAAAAVDRVQSLTLRAISAEQTLRVAPNPVSWSRQPDAVIRSPEPPVLLNLVLPVAYAAGYPHLAVVIDKVDHGRLLTVHHVAPDSNNDLRLALNSSALGAGEYRLRLQSYSLQGERSDVGWVRIVIQR